jgi:hypothetical protein
LERDFNRLLDLLKRLAASGFEVRAWLLGLCGCQPGLEWLIAGVDGVVHLGLPCLVLGPPCLLSGSSSLCGALLAESLSSSLLVFPALSNVSGPLLGLSGHVVGVVLCALWGDRLVFSAPLGHFLTLPLHGGCGGFATFGQHYAGIALTGRRSHRS